MYRLPKTGGFGKGTDRRKAGLRKFQTDYAEKMKPFGLSRGLEGSLAKHENVKQYYARVNAPVEKTISFEPKVFESKTAAITRMIDEVVKPIAQKAYEQQERLRVLITWLAFGRVREKQTKS